MKFRRDWIFLLFIYFLILSFTFIPCLVRCPKVPTIATVSDSRGRSFCIDCGIGNEPNEDKTQCVKCSEPGFTLPGQKKCGGTHLIPFVRSRQKMFKNKRNQKFINIIKLLIEENNHTDGTYKTYATANFQKFH